MGASEFGMVLKDMHTTSVNGCQTIAFSVKLHLGIEVIMEQMRLSLFWFSVIMHLWLHAWNVKDKFSWHVTVTITNH